MPRGQAATEANAAAASQAPAGGGAPASGTPAAGSGAPAGGGAPAQGASKFTLPAELAGKSAEEVAQYYGDRYKDYDEVKGRADRYGEYEKLNLKPDQIGNVQKWVTDVLAGLQGGKRAALDPRTNQIVFIDDKGQQTQAPAQAAEDWLNDFELLDPRQQAERQAKHVWDGMLAPRVQELVTKYDTDIANAVRGMDAKFNTFMDALELWQANPDLKIRDVLARANDMMRQNPTDLLRNAADAILSPKQQELKIKEEAAKLAAEMQAKWEAEHQAPALGAATGASHRFALDVPKNKGEARNRFLSRSQGRAVN